MTKCHDTAWYVLNPKEGWKTLGEDGAFRVGIHWYPSEREAVKAIAKCYKKYGIK